MVKIGQTSPDFLKSAAQLGETNCPERVFTIRQNWVGPHLSYVSTSTCRISSVGSHLSYADGTPRTLLRGWLHGILTVVLCIADLSLIFALLLQKLPVRWIIAVFWLAGKTASYMISSILHLFPFQTFEAERLVHRTDMAMIPVSIGVSPTIFILQLDEYLVSCAFHAMLAVLGIMWLVRCLRGVFFAQVAVQFLLAILQVGLHTGFTSPFWLTGVTCYFFGFIAFERTLHPESKFSMPWHHLPWYGWHDDFHTLLFFADLTNFIAGVLMLTDPSQDQKPNWWFPE